MKNSFIHSLFSEVVLLPAIRHSLANPLGKPAILLLHISILIYYKRDYS